MSETKDRDIEQQTGKLECGLVTGEWYLVTTDHRGVFFGRLESATNDGETMILEQARNCIYFCSKVGGVFGLAASGPVDGCRIGAKVNRLRLRACNSASEATPEAVKAWCEFPTHTE